jgi:hypothetical protein
VLFGLPELDEHLHLDEPLAQRVAVKCRLESFNRESTEGYITHRLRMAGAKSQLFTNKAFDAVNMFSRGIPRLINTVCDNCLFEGYLLKQKNVDDVLVKSIASDLGLVIKEAPKKEPARPRPVMAPVPAAAPAPAQPPAPPEQTGDSTEVELEKAINRAVVNEKEAEETEELDAMLDQIIETEKPAAAQPRKNPEPQAKPETKKEELSDEASIDDMLDKLDKN